MASGVASVTAAGPQKVECLGQLSTDEAMRGARIEHQCDPPGTGTGPDSDPAGDDGLACRVPTLP